MLPVARAGSNLPIAALTRFIRSADEGTPMSDPTVTVSGEPASDQNWRQFRDALGQFPTGVAIVTARTLDGADLGMTISSFNAVSLQPPLVLFCIDRHAHSLPPWLEAPAYGVSILSVGQDWLANQFAKPLEDKWARVRFHRGYGGVPLIDGCVAQFDCRASMRYEGGDHVIFVAEVVRYHVYRSPGPLVFCQGRYNNLQRGAMAPPDWPLPIHY